MIIKPQIYNLRLITFALLALVVALGYNTYQNRNSINEYHDFLLSEKTSVEEELNSLYLDYNELDLDNQDLRSQLDSYKIKIATVLDDIKYAKADVKLVSYYKEQLQLLKSENRRILKLVDQLNAENEFLRQETLRFETELEETLVVSNSLKTKNSSLSNINYSLNKKINKAKALTIQSIDIEGVRRITSSGAIKSTNTARRAKKLNVCFNIPENKFASKEQKELYIQVIDPNSNVVGDKGEVVIGSKSLIFSKKVIVDYNNEQLSECIIIDPIPNEKLIKGNYFVGVYHQNKLIGNTTFILK